MENPLIHAFAILCVIFLGYALKRVKLLNLDVAKRLSYVVMYITLPCAILYSASGIAFDVKLLNMLGVSFIANLVLIFVGYLTHRSPDMRMFAMINLGGFNIGNFVIPFVASIVSPHAFLALCMFDVINALFCFGGTVAIAQFCNRKSFPDKQINILSVFKEMSKSVPCYAYLIAIACAAAAFTLPPLIMQPIELFASGNTFLCMLVIGIAINFNVSFEQIKKITSMLLLRYGTACFLIALIWLALPLIAEVGTEVQMLLTIIMLAPMPSIAPILTLNNVPQYTEEAADLNTITIMASIVLITVVNSFSTVLTAA